MRWQVEVTSEAARRHLGIETQRQWSDKAIARTTPLLLGLFAWITLVAHGFHSSGQPVVVRQSAWYAKSFPTFSDALALVRHQLWFSLPTFQTSGQDPDMIKVSRPFFVSLVETLSLCGLNVLSRAQVMGTADRLLLPAKWRYTHVDQLKRAVQVCVLTNSSNPIFHALLSV